MQIHISRGEDQFGPFTMEQVQDHLIQGALLPDDLAWHEGMEDWIPLSNLVDSLPIAPSSPETLVQPDPTIESVPEEVGGKKKLLIGIGAGVAVVAIAVAAWYCFSSENEPQPSSETPKIPVNLLWEFETEGAVWSSPAIAVDGTVYVGSGDKKVYALDGKTGAKQWEYITGGPVATSPAIGMDGTVYIGSDDKKVYALNGKTGVKLWELMTGGPVTSSPAIGSDGTVYVGSWDKKLYAINPKSGAKKWEYIAGGPVASSPSIGVDGTVYVGSGDKKVYALDGRTGVKKWEFETGWIVRSSPVIGADGSVYVGSYDKKVYALDGKTGAKKWAFMTGDDVTSSPVIGADGTVYIGSVDKKIYAIKTDSEGPARSPWPMRGQNPEHAGRVPGARAPVAPGKVFTWTIDVNKKSLNIFYRNRSYKQVLEVFGKPDQIRDNYWWSYTGLRIYDASGNKYGTALFGLSNGMVQEVRVEK